MSKTHVYFVPGLAANSKIFEFITLPKEHFELHFLEWIIPISIDEPIEVYAKRMSEVITEENPVIIGVSFGGIVAQEISKHLNSKKVIIISSIKKNNELPKRLKIAQYTKAYKLFPTKVVQNIEEYTKFFFGDFLKKRAKLYKIYLSERDPLYLHWSIYNVLHWKQSTTLKDIVHIHGTDDHIFPIKHIKDCIIIEGGTHEMILMKAKTISKHIEESLTI
jgi:hypothetical protein